MINFIDILHIDAKEIKQYLTNLDNNGELNIILPELIALKGVDISKETSHKDNFIHTLSVIENTYYASKNPWLRLVSILHDIGKAPTKAWIDGIGWSFHNHEYIGGKMLPNIFNRLNIPIEYRDYITKIVVNHGYPKELGRIAKDSALRRFHLLMGDELEDLFIFCRCDLTSSNIEKKTRQINAYNELYEKIVELKIRDEKSKWRCPIDGSVIMKHFNLTPCRLVGDIRKNIEDAIKDGIIEDDYEEAYKFMLNIKIETKNE